MTDPRKAVEAPLGAGDPRSTRGRRERMLQRLIEARQSRRSPSRSGSWRWRTRLLPPDARERLR
jgi:hypothetical protein